jgi:hypothetical protein
VVLDGLLALADAHVETVARGGDGDARSGPVGVTDRAEHQRRLDAEDARMAVAARELRGRG